MNLRLLALVLFILAAPEAAAQTPSDEAVRRRLDSLLTHLHQRGWFDGALVAGRGGSVLYARGFGFSNVAAGVRFTPQTPSDSGSLAKTFTTTAVLMLEEAGLLRLDDPVQRYLPEYPYRGTTVAHLITHRAGGLPDYDYFWARVGEDDVLTNERLLAVLAEHRPELAHAPGSQFEYSSPAFDLAALIVERISGQSYESFLRDRVFRPLGMQTIFARPGRFADWPGVRTMSYRRAGDSLVVFDVWDREGFHGGSNLYLSADDLYRWVASFTRRPVLSEPALARGLGPVHLDDGRATGINLLSWYSSPDRTRFTYPGVLQGFYSVGYWDTTGTAIAFVTNSRMPDWLRARLTAALVLILETGSHLPLAPPRTASLSPEDFPALAGEYDLGVDRRSRIVADEDKVYVDINGGTRYRMFPTDEWTFYVPGQDAWVSFAELRQRRPHLMRWATAFEDIEARRLDH